MAISDERRAWIINVANGETFNELSDAELDALSEDDADRPSREFFASVADPAELHVFADAYNWDGGLKDVWRVIWHPLCDLGTALLVYWRAQPRQMLQHPDREALPEYQREDWDLLREIEQRVAAGAFTTAAQPLDLANDNGYDARPKPHMVARLGRDLPAAMYAAVGGRAGSTS